MTKTVYAPDGLYYTWKSSSCNYCTKTAEEPVLTMTSDTVWDITTTYATGNTSYIYITIDPLPEDLVESLSRLQILYGNESIGSWSEEYIPKNFRPGVTITQSAPVKPATANFRAVLTPKTGMTVAYSLVPDPKTLTTEADGEYYVRYSVAAKDADGDSDITDTPQTPSDTETETAYIIVSIGPLPQDMIDSLQRIYLSYGKESLGGWSEEYIASNFENNKVKTQTRTVTPGTQTVSAHLTAKDGMELKYDLVPDISSLTTEAGGEYKVSFTAVSL